VAAPNPRDVVLTRGPEASTDGAPPARAVGRRAALPSGRAVVGGLLVAAAVVGTYAAWSGAGDGPDTRFAVAARDLPVGTTVAAEDLELVVMDLNDDVAARAFDDPAAVVGQLTVAPLAEGDLVQRSAVVVPEDAAAGRQISLSISIADALAGTLEEGEAVDLLATFGDGHDAETRVVVADAHIARLTDEENERGAVLVLLALPEGADVLQVTRAVQAGRLTLVRTVNDTPLETGASSSDDSTTSTSEDTGGG
jgi:Flp pilus assembly protein CpaB